MGSMFQSYWKAVIGAPSVPAMLIADFWLMCMKQTKQKWSPGDISLLHLPTRLHCFRAHCPVPARELQGEDHGDDHPSSQQRGQCRCAARRTRGADQGAGG